MELVDTHCHIQSAGRPTGEENTRELWSKAPDLTPDQIINTAVQAGVKRMVCVGCTLDDSRSAIDFVQQRPECWASIGIHPHEAKDYAGNQSLQEQFAALASQPKVVAIGECGLDYFYGHSPKEAQEEVLRFQVELALQHNLPLIFHVREALDDFWPIFDDYTGIRGVLHSFTDTEENLHKAVERGLYIGINGIATFAKSPQQREMYQAIPLDNLLLETDAPFLTPIPHRGTICEPYHISVIAEFLSGHRQESLEQLAAATSRNAIKLFRIEP
ncbi:MAG TPA: TatD family hydrolase [Candidatus Limnocylindrales bacterium]|nr:TatD family hydrolase [Candidatus Limnocylindrales bacterium]